MITKVYIDYFEKGDYETCFRLEALRDLTITNNGSGVIMDWGTHKSKYDYFRDYKDSIKVIYEANENIRR